MSNMKLCKVCSKEVAKSAKICPHCGANLKMGIGKKLGIGLGIVVVLIIIISISSNSSSKSSNTQAVSQNQNQTSQSNVQPPQESSAPKWNTSETDITKNGNVSVAVQLIKSNGNLKVSSTSPDISQVTKAPWNYYGKVVKSTGQISDIQDYPVGSDWSKGLGGKEAGQIVITDDNGNITDMLVVGSTSNLKNGDTVTLYGYPVGLADVENKVGGKNTQLVIVGNSFDKN